MTCVGLALSLTLALAGFLVNAETWAQAGPVAPLSSAATGSVQDDADIQVSQEAFVRDRSVPEWVEAVPIPDAEAHDPLVILLADTQLLLQGPSCVSVRRVLAVNEASALAAAGQISIEFAPAYQRLELHRVRIRRKGAWLDHTLSSRIRFVAREAGFEAGFYGGLVTAAVLVDDLRVGDVLEVHYSIQGDNPVFGGRFAYTAAWDEPLPTVLRRTELTYPRARPISWKWIGAGADRSPAALRRDEGQRVALVFEERNLKAVAPEANLPADFQAYRTLQFSEFQSWDDVVQWASALFPPHPSPSPELAELVAGLRREANARDQVAAALEFVQTQIRYVSLSLGASSHRPAPPNEVLGRRYGDCKDKTFLLMSLLEQLGIASRPVLLDVGRRHGLEALLPSPLDFNHVILQADVDGHSYFLDATRRGQHAPLENMGQLHQGTQILLVDAATHAPGRIEPAPLGMVPDDELDEIGHFARLDGAVEFETHETWSGYRAEVMRSLVENVTEDGLDRILLTSVQRRFPEAALHGHALLEDRRQANEISLSGRFTLPRMLEEQAGNWTLAIAPPNLAGLLPYPIAADRHSPVGFSLAPLRYRYSLELDFPDTVSGAAEPQLKTVRGPGFSVSSASAFRGHTQKLSVELIASRDRIEAEEARPYNEAVRASQALTRVLAFVPADAVRGGDGLGSAQGTREAVQKRQENAVRQISATIAAAQLGSADLARAYCDRARALGLLGRLDEALRDADRAVQMAPDLPEVFTCRAALYFDSGAFQKSTLDYSHALSLGVEPGPVLLRRGITRYYQSDYERALEDFRETIRQNPADEAQDADVWLVCTALRLHRPPPEAIRLRAAAQSHGTWPRPALALLTGALTPEDFQSLIESDSGGEGDRTRAQGYFYLAQHFLLGGDAARARGYLLSSRGAGPIGEPESTAAQWELDRLAGAAPALERAAVDEPR